MSGPQILPDGIVLASISLNPDIAIKTTLRVSIAKKRSGTLAHGEAI